MEASPKQDKVLELFQQGPNILENALSDLGDNELDYVPSNGGWTIRHIIHHVVDGDDIWKIGIKMAFGIEENEFNLNWYIALPQIEWAKRWNYEKRSIDKSLTLFRAIRSHIQQLLENGSEGWDNLIKFRNLNGEIEVVSVGFVIQMQVEHVEHHVKRILEIRKEISGA